MIKANELRIGNLILRNGFLIEEKEKFKETTVTHNDITACYVDNTSFKPIPLTEEWLLKFGFEKDNDFGNWHLSAYEIFSSGNRDFVYWYNHSSDDYYSDVRKINTVHQLQNLYFALTGQELELK